MHIYLVCIYVGVNDRCPNTGCNYLRFYDTRFRTTIFFLEISFYQEHMKMNYSQVTLNVLRLPDHQGLTASSVFINSKHDLQLEVCVPEYTHFSK